MPYGIRQSAAPAEEPITLAEARAHLRITSTAEDSLISRLIKVARGRAEAATRRQLVTATWVMTRDDFPSGDQPLKLYRPPVASVTKVEYYDESNALVTWGATKYQTDLVAEPARILPVSGESWPTTYDRMNAVQVTYVAGYGAAAAVPDEIKQAILVLLAELFERREESVVGTIVSPAAMTFENLLEPYSIKRFL